MIHPSSFILYPLGFLGGRQLLADALKALGSEEFPAARRADSMRHAAGSLRLLRIELATAPGTDALHGILPLSAGRIANPMPIKILFDTMRRPNWRKQVSMREKA